MMLPDVCLPFWYKLCALVFVLTCIDLHDFGPVRPSPTMHMLKTLRVYTIINKDMVERLFCWSNFKILCVPIGNKVAV